MKKRIVSILLTFCMVLMLVPITAFAANDDATELQSLLNGGTVTLTKDYTIDTTLEVTKTVTLDLNGHVIKMTGSGSVIKVRNYGNLTMTDSNNTAIHTDTSLPAGGVITGGNESNEGGGVQIISGSMTMNGGTIANCSAGYGGGVYVGNSANFYMNGGTITNCTATTDNKSFGGGGVYIDRDGSFTMSGGIIENCSAASTFGGGVFSRGDFSMSGNAIIRDCRADAGGGVNLEDGYTFTMTGGTIEACRSTKGKSDAIRISFKAVLLANGGIVKGTVISASDSEINTTSIAGCTKFYNEVTNRGTISGGVYYGGISGDGTVSGTYHTITFDTNGGSSVPTQYFVGIDTAPALKPADPVKEYHDFTGWFTDAELTKPYSFDSAVTENLTLYAGFKPVTYTVTYYGGEGEGGIASGTKTHGVDYTLSSETFTSEGYVQYGWQDKEGKFYKLGGVYSENADVTLYPVWDEIITVTAPFTTTVELGGNAEPGAKTFELMLIDSMANKLIFEGIKVTASVDTDGAGEYKGELTVTGPCRQLDKMLGEYAFVRQIDDGEENWTIDDTVWAVRFYQQEIAARSMSEVLYSLHIQPAYIKDTGDGLFYAVDINAEPLDEMSFTNVYTAHEHEYELKHDENGHWDECGCGDIQNKELHKYGDWKVTKEATQTAKGEKEHACTICGYTETAEIAKLPATTEPTNPDTKPGKDNPATGDNSHMALWFALLFVSGAGVIGTTVYGKKKRAK